MEALCFTLSGRMAFFKKPEVNTYVYFTYGNIHKVALLGIFGAILGYGGHTQKFNQTGGRPKQITADFPEFYEKLNRLHVAIEPGAERGFFRKKIQTFNNSVGYASKEQGGNLVVKEQWLEHPSWNIYVLLDCEQADRLCKTMLAGQCIYIPYLGKNEHGADISDVRVEKADETRDGQGRISALYPKENGTIQTADDWWEKQENMTYKYEEKLPAGMDE